MAAALYAFSAVKVYLEEGLASAQFFLLSARDGHFAALNPRREGEPLLRPPGAVLGLLRERLDGERIAVDVRSPTYQRDGQLANLPTVDVPYVEALACRWEDGTVQLLLANKHPDFPARVRIRGVALPSSLKVTLLTGSGPMRDEAHLKTVSWTLKPEGFLLPAASIAALSWAGESPPP
jgi:hypothetical protein